MKIKTLNPLKHEFINAKTILLKVTPKTNIIRDENNNIVKLETDVGVTIEIGDEVGHNFETLNSNFIVKEILQDKTNKFIYILNSGIINKVYTYLLPSLFQRNKYTYKSLMIDTYFLECFVSLQTNELVLCYRYSKLDLYTELQELITSHPNFTRLVHKNGYDYYCFSLNINDLNSFILGKYSYLSNELKFKIREFFKLKKDDHILMVLNKDKRLKKKLEDFYNMKIHDSIELDEIPNDKDLINLDDGMLI